MNCDVDPTMKARLMALLKREWVTPATAHMKAGCMSLAQRVSEWSRRDGYEFHKRWVKTGPRTRVMSYKFARGPK